MSPATLLLTFVSVTVVAFAVLVGGLALGHDFHADHGLAGDGTGSVFSTRVLGTFGLGLGGAGAIATLGGVRSGPALCIGLASGALLGAAVWAFWRLLSGQQGSMLFATRELVGCVGVVTTAIGRGVPGEVNISRGETSSSFLARAQSGSAIARGQAVRVTRAVGSLLFVEETSASQDADPRDSNRFQSPGRRT